METMEQEKKQVSSVLMEEINRVDYARLYDMTNLEINLFYKQKEYNLDQVIEQDYVDLIYEIRDALVEVRRNKTKIKNLRSELAVPEMYIKKMLKDIYEKATSNIRSLKITLKKTNEYIKNLEKQIRYTEKNESTLVSEELVAVLKKHLYFFMTRKIYYEGAINEYKKAIDYAKSKEEIRKNDKKEFKNFSINYVESLLSQVDIEEKFVLEKEKMLCDRLDNVKKSLDFYRNNISKVFQ